MSTQTKASSGGGRNKGGSNKSSNAAVSAQAETNNNNASAKKQHNDQPKTEKDKPHVKVSANVLDSMETSIPTFTQFCDIRRR